MPLAAAAAWICWAKASTSGVSAVEDTTNSTGNWPPPGRDGGVTGNTCTPGMAASFCATSGMIWKIVRLRLPQGLTTMPPKPEAGWVIWKVNSVSGVLMKALFTCAA